MENLRIMSVHTKDTLSHLQSLIHQQKQALGEGSQSNDIAAQLQAWEQIVQQLRAEMALEKSAQLSLLYEVSQTINASLDWKRTVQAVLSAVIRLTGAERGMLLIYDGQGQLNLELTSVASGEPFSEQDMQFSRSVVSQCLEQNRPVLTTNAASDPRFQDSDSVITYGLRSIICVPLKSQDSPLGVVYLDNRARSGVFTQEDLTLLTAFAHQAALALDKAQKHQKTNRALSEKIRELTILQEMARDLNVGLNFDRVMERSIAWAIAASGAEGGAIGLLGDDGIRWEATVGEVQPVDVVAMRCVYTRKPLQEDKRIILPLLREGRPVGVLYLVAEERTFNPEKFEFVQRSADNIAIAVENARLYEALRRANMAKSEFISLVSHELRTPMTSIQGYAEMLSKGLVGRLAPKQQEFIEAIERNVNRMRILVNDLMDISRIETGQLTLNVQPTDFAEAVREARSSVEEMIRERLQVLSVDIWPGLPKAMADPERLIQILINLLSNAVKYTPYQGLIAVRAWLSLDEPEFIRCAIADTGIGIAPEDQVRLFTKFFRADDPRVREQAGTGLGLAITRSLVEMQGGRIWVESEPGQGSTFYFTVPIALPGDK